MSENAPGFRWDMRDVRLSIDRGPELAPAVDAVAPVVPQSPGQLRFKLADTGALERLANLTKRLPPCVFSYEHKGQRVEHVGAIMCEERGDMVRVYTSPGTYYRMRLQPEDMATVRNLMAWLAPKGDRGGR